MNWKPPLKPTIVALTTLVAWWVGLLLLDGTLGTRLPYEQYRIVALLYPGVFYPGIPGMVLAELLFAIGAHALFGGLTFEVGLFGGIVVLAVAIGIGAEKYASGRNLSPSTTAAGSILVLFVSVTVIEAVAFFA